MCECCQDDNFGGLFFVCCFALLCLVFFWVVFVGLFVLFCCDFVNFVYYVGHIVHASPAAIHFFLISGSSPYLSSWPTDPYFRSVCKVAPLSRSVCLWVVCIVFSARQSRLAKSSDAACNVPLCLMANVLSVNL